MRTFSNIKAFLLPLLLVLTSCTSTKDQVSKAAYNYLDAMGNYRIDEAYAYASKETQETTLDFIKNNIMPIMDSVVYRNETPAVITISNVELTSDTTATVLFHKSTPTSERNNLLSMVYRDGKWQANVIINTNQNKALDGKKVHKMDSTRYRNLEGLTAHPVDTTNRRPAQQ